MAAQATRVYPLATAENGQPLAGIPGIPNVTTEVATKGEAEALVATGHFTFNANDSRRIPESNPTPATPAPEE